MSPPLTARLVLAYLQTTYRVHTPHGDCELRIGRPHPELDTLLESCRADAWGFLTAANPHSRPLTSAENAVRNSALQQRLQAAASIVWPGTGVGDSGCWEPEESFFAAGCSLEELVRIGGEFDQHAIVAANRGAPADLLFCGGRDVRATIEAAKSHSVDSMAIAALDRSLAWLEKREQAR